MGRRAPGAAILIYHSIARVRRDPFAMAVSPEQFAGHMAVLAKHFTPLSLRELVAGLGTGTLPERAVAVTFDDGYANNLGTALPILRANGIPATVFISSGYIGGDREFWWDELDRLLEIGAVGGAGSTLELTLGSESRRFAMADTPPARNALRDWLIGRSPDRIEAGLQQLGRWAGLDRPPVPREEFRALTGEELTALAAVNGIEIGAHTRGHVQLAAHPRAGQDAEVTGSRDDLTSWLGRAPVSFAYPYGNPGGDYSAVTVAAVRDAGFVVGVSTRGGLATAASDPLQLPRYFVTAREPESFRGWLAARSPSPVRRLLSRVAATATRR